MQLRIATLNVRGFKSLAKQAEIVNLAHAARLDVVFLQETNFKRSSDVFDFKRRFRVDCFFSLATHQACGVGILIFRKDLMRDSFFTHDAEGRVICLDTVIGGKKTRFVNVYAPADNKRVNDFFSSLEPFLLNGAAHTIIGGDFNCVLDGPRDARSPVARPRAAWCTRTLQLLVTERGLIDAWIHVHGLAYIPTWQRGDTSSRLDRFYLSPALVPHLRNCEVLNPSLTNLTVSDHQAVVITINVPGRSQFQHRVWKLSTALLIDPDITGNIKDYLDDTLPQTEPTIQAWEGVKGKLRLLFTEWGKKRARMHTQLLNSVAMKIRILTRAPSQTALTLSDIEVLRAQHLELLRSTSLVARVERFQAQATGGPGALRYLRTREDGRAEPQSEFLTDTENSLPQFTNYFRDLFRQESTATDAPDLDSLLQSFPTLGEAERHSLAKEATLEELDEAVERAKRDSAPGPDGLPHAFYKTFWVSLRDYFVRFLRHLFHTPGWRSSFTSAMMIMIPKPNSSPSDPSTWRPISLLNCDYKIVMSVLATRVRQVLADIVHPAQTCAVPGRSMYEALSATRDLIAYTTSRGDTGVAVSLDQRKAFDRVDHKYLFSVLERYGFPHEFVNILQSCYRDAEARIRLGAASGPVFPIQRGVRQGCPLSPLLFTLVIDPFIRSTILSSRVLGLPLPGSGFFSVSAYADDVTFFLRDGDSVLEVFRLFRCYASMSGAALNTSKSQVMPIGQFQRCLPPDLLTVQRLKMLGVVFTPTGLSATNWDDVTNELRECAEHASLFPLTWKEKAFVIKAVLCAKAWHLGHVQIPTTAQAMDVHSVIFHFFWERRIERVGRQVLHKARDQGGWSIPNVLLVSRTLALRSALQALDSPEHPACILALYGMGPLGRFLVSSELFNRTLKRETPGRHYAAVVSHARYLRERHQIDDLLSVPAARVSELHATENSPTPQHKLQQWKNSGPPWMPGPLADFQWEVTSNILPTKARLFRWRILRSPDCVFCKSRETTAHVLAECHVARRFWARVAKKFQLCVPVNYERERHGLTSPRGKMRSLITATGRHLLWKARCRATFFQARFSALNGLTHDLCTRLRIFLSKEFEELGEDVFERSWGLRDVVWVRQGKLEMRGARALDF